MHFRTSIKIKKNKANLIDYKSTVFMIGSCFTQNIGDKFNYYKYKNFINPFGVLFHPTAIENVIRYSLEDKVYTEKELFFHNEQWHCFDVHSDFSQTEQSKVLGFLNKSLLETKNHLQHTSHIIITLGTAWVYKNIETIKTVANCHKVPQNKFTKKLLSVEDILSSLNTVINKIRKVNSNAEIIFTVSPVRHLKDGFVENQQSKAHLITAIHQSLDIKTHYFPAYEIMADDLRDYRFYKTDMIHPNEVAISYIWKTFVNTWINFSEKETMEMVEQVRKGLAHKPFNKQSKQHQVFLAELKKKKQYLETTKNIVFL